MTRKGLLIHLLFMVLTVQIFITCLLVENTSAQEVINLRFADFLPGGSFASMVNAQWIKEVEARTKGKVKITLYAGGTLLKADNMYDGVTKGIADIGYSLCGYTPGRFPLCVLLEGPIGSPSPIIMNRVVWRLFKKFNPDEFKDTKVLYLNAPIPASYWGNKPVKALEDFAGLEIRVPGAAVETVKALGGVPVAAPQGETYEMLRKGIVKGSLSSPSNLKIYREAETVKYFTYLNLYHGAIFYAVMNLNSWKALPQDIQKVMDDLSQDWTAYVAEIYEHFDAYLSLDFAKDKGLEMFYPSEKEMNRIWNAVNPVSRNYIVKLQDRGVKDAKPWSDEAYSLIQQYKERFKPLPISTPPTFSPPYKW